jgi:phosphoglycerate dehydrogenase-like enzyme
MKPRILVTLQLAQAEQEYMLSRIPEAEVRFVPSERAAEPDLSWATVVFGNVAPAERLLPHRELRWLHTPNVGLDDYQDLLERCPNLRITRASGVVDDAVAEHAVAMLLYLTRGLDVLARAQQQHAWSRQAFMARGVTVVAGKSAHVLGYGAIARCLVEKLLGLGMRVCVYRRQACGKDPRVERFHAFESLPREAANADVLLCLLPDQPQTRHLVSADVLRAMKRSAYVVNVGRGSVVDESALAEALSRGRLAGTALDVFDTEPLSATSSLWDLSNVLISPHVAGRFDMEVRRHVEQFVRLARQFAGETEGSRA